MKVLLLADPLVKKVNTGGIDAAYKNQQKALELIRVPWTSDPKEDFDILHLHLNPLSPFSVIQLLNYRRKATKTIVHCHSTTTDFANALIYSRLFVRILPFYIRFVCHLADLVLCPSEFARTLIESYHVKRPIKVMDNGVDLGKFTRSEIKRDIFRRRYGLRGEVIFSVGFVFPRKGIFDFIEMARRFPEHQFIWCGKKFKTWLTARPFAMRKQFRDLPSNVRFLGYVPDIEGAYNAGDIFLFPSYAENQGMPISEAAAVGKPVIVRALLSYQDWLVHEMNCLMADDNDEFAESIRILIEDEPLKNKLAGNGRQMAEERSLEAVGRKLKRIYEDLLDQ